MYDERSLNTSRPYSNSKSHLPRKQENLGSRNRFSAAEPEVHSQARESIRSLIINSSAHNPEKMRVLNFSLTKCLLRFIFFAYTSLGVHKTHSNSLYFSISVSHIRLAGQRANWQTQARYGRREIQTQPQSGLCLGGISNY
ncbi:hypothetical protein IHE44_0011874, partial [Lamprotornis superbus]